MKGKRIFLIVLIILVIIVALFFILTSNAKKIIAKKFSVELPISSEIIRVSYNRFNGNFVAKIEIDRSEVDTLKSSLSEYFIQEKLHEKNSDYRNISMNYTPEWWDLSPNENLICFSQMENGVQDIIGWSKPLTAYTSAVISENNDENYYLYVAFMISPWNVIF